MLETDRTNFNDLEIFNGNLTQLNVIMSQVNHFISCMRHLMERANNRHDIFIAELYATDLQMHKKSWNPHARISSWTSPHIYGQRTATTGMTSPLSSAVTLTTGMCGVSQTQKSSNSGTRWIFCSSSPLLSAHGFIWSKSALPCTPEPSPYITAWHPMDIN